MSIENRGLNKWRFTISKDGQIYRKNFTGTEKAAKKAHDAFKVDIERGDVGINESMRFGQLAQMVMDEYVKVRLKYSSQCIYKNNYNLHILPVFGNLKISSIKPFHIQQFSNKMEKEFSPNTVQNALSVLSVTLNYAVKWGFISESPFRHIDRPSTDRKAHDELMSMENIQKLLLLYESETNTLHKSAFYLAIGCGLRNSEIRALTNDDIDFEKSTIRVNKQDGLYVDEDGEVKSGNTSTKTSGSTRTIHAPEFVMDALRDHMSALPYASITKQIFFNAITGKPISKHCLSKRFTTLLKSNHLPQIRFHDLRHLHATMLINSGANVKSVSKRLGHSTLRTTIETYTHTIDAVDKEVANGLDDTIKDIKIRGSI